MTIYAIGDIHGMYKLTFDLIQKIRDDMDEGPHKIIFLGDYIDRGPDSAGVIDFIIGLQKDFYGRKDVEVIALLGNHEQMMLDAVYGGYYGNIWYMNGGTATVNSYGGDPNDIYDNHLDWLKNLPLFHVDGKCIFVHAGVNPCIGLDEQSKEEMLWIREDFLRYRGHYFGYTIIHGHTPTTYWKKSVNPDIFGSRIGVDTGAEHSGVLTAIKIFDSKKPYTSFSYEFIQAKDEDRYAEFYQKYIKRWKEQEKNGSSIILP